MTVEPLDAAFARLGEMIRDRARGRRVHFLVGDGNLGDGLIRLGSQEFLRDLGLPVTTHVLNNKQAKLRVLAAAAADVTGRRTLFLQNGGGGWATHCSVARRDVERQLRVTSNVVVLPSTYEEIPLRTRPTLVRRDEVGSREVAPEAAFCHDMAFYLALVPTSRWFPSVDSVAVDRRTGVFFRLDNEAAAANGSLAVSHDLSADGTVADDLTPFLKEIARSERVVTDRLHVAIAATLLKKEVVVAAGKTWKIPAIFETSIAPYFPNCRLVDGEVARRVATEEC